MKWARRTDWELAANAIARELERLRQAGEEILDLTESNPTRCALPLPDERALAALQDAANLCYAPSPRGLLHAREAVCAYYARRGIVVSPEQIFLTASTSEAYSFLFRLLADPGDRVLFPRPSYPLFQFLGDLNDVEVATYPLRYAQGWQLDPKDLAALAFPAPRAVVLVNPNNPTGSYVSQAQHTAVNGFCRRHRAAVICDEVFYDYRFDRDRPVQSLAGNTDVLTFVLGGLSKAMALPQMKVSWIVLSGPEDEVREAGARLEVIADTYLSVNTPCQNALPAWLETAEEVQQAVLARLSQNLGELDKALKCAGGVHRLAAEGGWYALLRLPGNGREEALTMELLRQDHVYVHPGYFFDFDEGPLVVVSLLPRPDVFLRGIEKILQRAGEAH